MARQAKPDGDPSALYARLTTESRHPRSRRLDRLTPLQILRLMNEEDRAVPLAVERVLPEVARVAERAAHGIREGGRLIYVGAGTSGRLGVLDATECPPTFGTPPELVRGVIAGGMRALVRSIEGAEDDEGAGARAMARHRVSKTDTVVGIAASRATPFVAAALRAASRRGAATALLCCSPEGDLPAPVDVLICPVVGPEVLTGSTRLKAGTAQKMVLNMITTSIMVQLGKTYENLMVDLQAKSRKLRDRSRRVVMQVAKVEAGEADEWLRRAGGSVKKAIVMARLGVSRREAERVLRAADGHLHRALGEKS